MTIVKPAIPLEIRGQTFNPPLILAPMAGVTHSAFRRLVADFGGCGALFSEMLSPGALLCENLLNSTFTKRRATEGCVIYQLRLTGNEDVERVIDRLSTIEPCGIDVNLGCPAPEVKNSGGGVGLFDDFERCAKTLVLVRKHWQGLLTVKCRLGKPVENWREGFEKRMRLFADTGIDAVTVHPRFSNEKLKRRARHDLFPWIASLTGLPLIANGDVTSAGTTSTLLAGGHCSGVMVGRMAVVKPWIFRDFSAGPQPVDYRTTWETAFRYIMEDFIPEKAIGRIKEFSTYFAQNFVYGHQLYAAVQGAKTLDVLRERAVAFLSANPAVENTPSVMGL